MGMFSGPKPGSWSLRSKKDPRWNDAGTSDYISIMGGMCSEAQRSLDRTKMLLEEEPPDDLEYSCMKD